ncbi:MAG: DUF4198 domain-containing protein [Desulfobacterales bacterium]|uniref:DUF4198 domain-containing protein n=1 Tax=Candidatus Desulfatibia vada TaxID=2841696 RepID=A0A8J6P675_9BACT|nr:DUF4198 domain-containing protein [Candidatus Desulfatibia vada]MBL6970767.1 DUF4198 domain-containing protein [Desulfobacterales bacterium]
MKRLRIPVLLAVVVGFCLGTTCQPACAHNLWLEVRDYTPQVGENISLRLAYDHYFPTREFMDKENLEEIYVLDPEGNKITIKAHSDVEFKGDKPLKEEGTYVIVAEKKGGFFTKTTEGYQRGRTKKGLKNVIQCTYSAKHSKAIVNVGKAGGKTFSKILGHDLEIVPLADPGALAQGDYLPIKVMFKGQPLSSNHVFATHMGFSTEKNTFAYATKTDKKGVANIKMLQSGVWLITTSHTEHYPDPAECDQYKFSSTLTFEIR